MSGDEGKSCPSYPPAAGAEMFGIVDARHGVLHLPHPLTLDADTARAIQASGKAGGSFRFAGPCAENQCGHWGGDRCTLVDRTLQANPIEGVRSPLPPCGIRPKCRWFSQNGSDACKVCIYFLSGHIPMVTLHKATIARSP